MKIGIYDPYLDTLGGGEKYILSIASILSQDHDVFLFWDDKDILLKGSMRFHLDLSKIHITSNIFSAHTPFFARIGQTVSYDRIIYMSDGSIPFLFGKKNFLLFQFPVPWIKRANLMNSVKLVNVSEIICYSDFVRDFLKKTFRKKITVLAPPVDIPKDVEERKENIILTVGRFTQGMNRKKQEVMIDAFKKLCDRGLKKWTFVLAGGALPADNNFIEELKKSTEGYPIEVYENIAYEKLLSFYKNAKIYWHAAGYGEDLFLHPERAEHFGITTVEAMSYGIVPVVFFGGGQTEIVSNGAGYTWQTLEELLEKTKKIIDEKTTWEKMSLQARERAKQFSVDIFSKHVKELFA